LRTALYPGSFDPVTKGHVDVATRAAALFDHLVIGVFDAPPKNLLFTTEERAELLK
jgi:pantetheine-phosphate adenylyltransferase